MALALLYAASLAVIAIYILVDDATLMGELVKRLESSSSLQVLHLGDARTTRTLSPTRIGR